MKTRKYFERFASFVQATTLLSAMLLTSCSSGSADITQSPPAESNKQTGVQIDTHCKTSADCAVKNIGNCCGAMPACVNKDSPTDPQAVQAQCQAKGMMGICGFREISACQCDNGQCVEAPAANGLRNAPLPTGLPH